MAGIENWFSFKSEAQRKKESEEYDRRLFPYGERQKEKIRSILADLIDGYNEQFCLYQYLVCKDVLLSYEKPACDREKISMVRHRLRYTMRKKDRDDLYSYLALCEYDIPIGERLDYPDIGILKKRAEEIKGI